MLHRPFAALCAVFLTALAVAALTVATSFGSAAPTGGAAMRAHDALTLRRAFCPVTGGRPCVVAH